MRGQTGVGALCVVALGLALPASLATARELSEVQLAVASVGELVASAREAQNSSPPNCQYFQTVLEELRFRSTLTFGVFAKPDYDQLVAEGCPKGLTLTGSPGGQLSVTFSGDFGFGEVEQQPTEFVLLRNPITLFEQRGLFKPHIRFDYEAFDAGIQVNNVPTGLTGPLRLTNIRVFAGTASGTGNVLFPSLDPLGQSAGLEGTGDLSAPFPFGVVLTAGVPLGTPGGANVIEDFESRFLFQSTTFGAEFRFPTFNNFFRPLETFIGPVTVTPVFGGSFTFQERFQTTSLRVPGFGLTAVWDTDLDIDIFDAYAGGDIAVAFDLGNIAIVPSLGARVGLKSVDVSGSDRFTMTGGVVTDQEVPLSGQDTSFYYQLSGGVNVVSRAVCAGASVSYLSGEYAPRVFRSGFGPSEVLFGDVDVLEFRVNVNVNLAPPGTDIDYTACSSDIRLKRDIAKVGGLPNGLALYRYRYLWSDTEYVGVMAQEVARVRPDAVMRGADGFLRVDYGKLGTRLMTWDEWSMQTTRRAAVTAQ